MSGISISWWTPGQLANYFMFFFFHIKDTVVPREQSGYLAMKMPIFVISEPLCQMPNEPERSSVLS